MRWRAPGQVRPHASIAVLPLELLCVMHATGVCDAASLCGGHAEKDCVMLIRRWQHDHRPQRAPAGHGGEWQRAGHRGQHHQLWKQPHQYL